MRSFLIILTLVGTGTVASSQQTNPADSVKASINAMFTAMRTGDEKLFRSVMAPTAILQGIKKNKDGGEEVYTEDVDGFARFIGQVKKDSADERIEYETVKVDAGLAIAWTPYKFYHNGQFSHCGVNSFQLVRLNGQWKIQYIIDTRRKGNCP